MFGGKCCWNFFLQKLLEEMPYLISVNSLLFKNIQYIGSRKHFVFVCVCVSLSLYLSFCKSSSRALSPPDDKLTGNIWFFRSRTSYSGDKWLKVGMRRRCHHGDDEQTNKQVNIGILE